jgi:hypothetical protein
LTTDSIAAGAPRSIPTGRFIDRGAVFAGWVGIGMAVVIAISFELVVTLQILVFLAAPIAGAVIGAYANVRSRRWRPVRRVLANAAWAGLITGLTLAILYGALRLLFVFADAGTLPDGTALACQPGPDCTYTRYVTPWPVQPDADPAVTAERERIAQAEADQRRAELAQAGVVDGESFGAFVVRGQLGAGLVIVALTLGGALVAGGLRSLRQEPLGDTVRT